ncbi:aminopeptidase P family protein [Metallosphaera tengchongensis]|uniref:Aminopeptidase P family protein n=1 Tax=Metallosphaera tengchongensis TaxID=1532350 RepID=A0A6N0NQZ6_9CREN|nr:aminopeptidase P family protein [Metallosphaera tengchongensis]QKQ99293.1 aminopeptidase P family protein [Metallosphaera tengchongensis]
MRLDKLDQIVEKAGVKNALILGEPNLFYFSGYRGVGGLLNCDGRRTLLVPLLEKYRGRKAESSEIDLKVYYPVKLTDDVIEGNMVTAIEKLCQPGINSKLLVDVGYIPVDMYLQLKTRFDVVDVTRHILNVRSIKEGSELEAIKRAQRATAVAMEKVRDELKENMTEVELAGTIDMNMRKGGAEDYAFPSIVAFGENGSEPHHVPGYRGLRPGDEVVIDIGAKFDGYSFDSTRTFLFGPTTGKMKAVYEIVLEAQLEAIDSINDGVVASEIDKVARRRIERSGYGQFFIHSTGHGVGIEVHESPSISMKSDDILKENMVITVEPGIYLDGEFGVRIEDTIIVRKGKAEVLETTYKTM